MKRKQKRPTIHEFAAQVQKELQSRKPDLKTQYEPSEGILYVDNQPCRLRNLFLNYLALPETQRRSMTDRTTSVILLGLTMESIPWKDAEPRLRPAVRPESKLDEQSGSPVRRPLSNELSIVLCLDFPEAIRYVLPNQLEQWDKSLDECLNVAIRNLEANSTEPFYNFASGCYGMALNDGYDASRILLLDKIRMLPLKGRPLAMVPQRDTLMVTGSEDEAGIFRMAMLAGEFMQGPWSLSGVPLILKGDEWIDWRDHVVAAYPGLAMHFVRGGSAA